MSVAVAESLVRKWKRRLEFCSHEKEAAEKEGKTERAIEMTAAAERALANLQSAEAKLLRAQATLQRREAKLARKAAAKCTFGLTSETERGLGHIRVLDGEWYGHQLHATSEMHGTVRYWFVRSRCGFLAMKPDKEARHTGKGTVGIGWRSKFEAELALQIVHRYEPEWLTPDGRTAALNGRVGIGSFKCETIRLLNAGAMRVFEDRERAEKQVVAVKKMAEQARGVELRAQLTTVRAQNAAARVQRKERDEAACQKALTDAAHARELLLAKCKTPGEKAAVVAAYKAMLPTGQDAQQIAEQSARRIMLANNALEDHRRTERREGRAPLDIGILGTNRTTEPNPWE